MLNKYFLLDHTKHLTDSCARDQWINRMYVHSVKGSRKLKRDNKSFLLTIKGIKVLIMGLVIFIRTLLFEENINNFLTFLFYKFDFYFFYLNRVNIYH